MQDGLVRAKDVTDNFIIAHFSLRAPPITVTATQS